MGASGWSYVTEYEGDVEAALGALHAREFQEEYGGEFASLEDLRQDEYLATEGTHSILDIYAVVATDKPPVATCLDDHGTLRPLALDRVVHHFGTERPTVERFRELIDAANEMNHEEFQRSLPNECRMRWTAYHVTLYSEDKASHLGIFGFSGD